MSEFLAAIVGWWATCSWLEVVGVLTGLACVWLYGKESVWAWPAGIVSTFAFMVIFYQVQLYSDTLLQVVFQVLNVMGWYEWVHGGPDKKVLVIRRGFSLQEFLLLMLSIAVLHGGAGYYFSNYSQADLPWWDAALLSLSLAAQWLLNLKRLESWLLWIAVDVLSIGVYFYKELYLTAVLYAIFLILAIKGFRDWKRSLEVKAHGLTATAAPELPAVPAGN